MDDLHVNVPITEQSCRRSEILVGPERRRRWNLAEKRRIIAESLAPGAVAAVVARRHGIHPNQLCDWKRALRRLASERISDFVPISVAATSPEELTSVPRSGALPAGPIEIVMDLATVRVPALVDASTLRRVLAVMKSLS
jgi:transposase